MLVFLTDVHKQLGTDSWTKEQLKEFVWNTLNSGKVRAPRICTIIVFPQIMAVSFETKHLTIVINYNGAKCSVACCSREHCDHIVHVCVWHYVIKECIVTDMWVVSRLYLATGTPCYVRPTRATRVSASSPRRRCPTTSCFIWCLTSTRSCRTFCCSWARSRIRGRMLTHTAAYSCRSVSQCLRHPHPRLVPCAQSAAVAPRTFPY